MKLYAHHYGCIALLSGLFLVFAGVGGVVFAIIGTSGYNYFNDHFDHTQCRYLNANLDQDGVIVPFFEVDGVSGIPFMKCDGGEICSPGTCCDGGVLRPVICGSCENCTFPRFSSVMCHGFNGSQTQKIGPYPWGNPPVYLPGVWYSCYTTTEKLPFMANATGCTSWDKGCVMMSRTTQPNKMKPRKFWGILVGGIIVPGVIATLIAIVAGLGYFFGPRKTGYEFF